MAVKRRCEREAGENGCSGPRAAQRAHKAQVYENTWRRERCVAVLVTLTI